MQQSMHGNMIVKVTKAVFLDIKQLETDRGSWTKNKMISLMGIGLQIMSTTTPWMTTPEANSSWP